MTREAELLIDMWDVLHRECHKVVTEENYDVIKKAIKALEQEPTTKNDLGVDCVARQDIERYIEGFINEYTPKEELEFINLELDGLKHLPSVTPQEPRWIPVSERLPEAEYGESDSVLVCFENETQDVLYFDGSNWCYPTGETYISVNHKNGWHNEVVAWMPLPQPYKAESEG